MRIFAQLVLALGPALFSQHALAWSGKAEHLVVVVWDGLRPDYVSSQYTPTLNELAKRGTFFKEHHSCYVTSTEVNGRPWQRACILTTAESLLMFNIGPI